MAKLTRIVLAEAGQPTQAFCVSSERDPREDRILAVAVNAAKRCGHFQVSVDEIEDGVHVRLSVSDAARQIHALEYRERRYTRG